ncbi:hypothetical protein [Methylobacterium indicum]|uniref:hypothetical protein n=1 Tax=Methylobacterium indicum TaxID=1775910 RepID=UPI0009E32106|nr:hypothetical protein [Methylobacterium indicum]
MSFAEYYRGFAGLGDAYATGLEENRLRTAASRVGQQLGAGDYQGAASTAFDAGDTQTGLGLLKLGETHRQNLLSQQASQAFANGIGALYGGGGGGGQLGPLGSLGSPQGGPAGKLPTFAGGGAGAMAMPSGTGGEAERRFVGALQAGGLTNPYGLAAVAAYANRESGYKGSNITGSWSDPSESGAPGQSGGILSWRGDRLANMRRFTAGAPDPVTAQAQFTLAENPRLTQALQNARSPEEANALMADAWRFAGYNRPGGENAARLNATRSYLARLNGGGFGGAQSSTQVATADDGMGAGMPLRAAPASRPVMMASADPQADMPAPDGSPAGYFVPPAASLGAPGSRSLGGGALTLPPSVSGEKGPGGRMASPARQASAQAPDRIGNVPVAAITAAPASGQAIGFLIQAAASPNLPDGQRQIAQILLKNKLDETSLPPEVKEYNLARAQGFTGTLLDYKRELKRPGGPTLLSPGQTVYDEATNSAKFTAPERNRSNIADDVAARSEAAQSLGLTPGSPEYKSYVLSGKMPREDQQPYTASDKKAILEADEAVAGAQTVIGNLQQAKDLSAKAYQGPTSKARALGTSFFGSEAGQATLELDNLVTSNALAQLKSIFGAAPTEGERKILLDIQGSSDLPHALRVKIYDRAIAAAERRLTLKQQQATEMRDRTYFQPGNGPAASRSGSTPAAPQRNATPQGAPALQDLEAEARRRGLIR